MLVSHLRRHCVAYVALVVALGGSAYAATNVFVGANGKIRACAAKKSGKVRLLKAGKKCTRRERAVAWNTQGPQGATGAPGANGADGAPATRYFATVDAAGTSHSGTATSTAREAEGLYNVVFDADIKACSAVVTPGTNSSVASGSNAGVSSAAYVGRSYAGTTLSANANSVAVETYASVGEGTDQQRVGTSFHVAVLC